MADITNPTTNCTIFGGDNPALSAAVTSTTDGAKERLDCDVTGSVSITDDEAPTKLQLKTDYDATGVSLNTSTDTTLYTFSGSGVIDLIAITCATTANYEVTIKIDGTERLRISMSDLGTGLGLTDSSFDIAALVANKQFRYHPSQIGFTTSFTVLAKATIGTPTVTHMVMYREKVT